MNSPADSSVAHQNSPSGLSTGSGDTDTPCITIEAVRADIQKEKARGLSWRQIAALPAYQGISHGALYAYAEDGQIPRDPAIRQQLGLPPLITVEGCLTCGGLHQTACPEAQARPSRPKRIRIEGRLDNEQQRLILREWLEARGYDDLGEYLRELADELLARIHR